MKGVVNKGIQEWVEERFGVDKWDEIRSAAGYDEPSFSPSLDYPDQMTVDLVAATARFLGLSPDETMKEFGKYWVSNTGKHAYPSLYALAGRNPRELLRAQAVPGALRPDSRRRPLFRRDACRGRSPLYAQR